MDAVQELLNEMNVQIHKLYYIYLNSKCLEVLEEKGKQLNEKLEEYKKSFTTKEYATQRIMDMKRRLDILSVPTLPMQYDRTELEQLRKEIETFSCFLQVDPDARNIQFEDISYVLRITKLGEKWEDKDKIIQTRDDTITVLKDQLEDKDRLIGLMKKDMAEMRQNLEEQRKNVQISIFNAPTLINNFQDTTCQLGNQNRMINNSASDNV